MAYAGVRHRVHVVDLLPGLEARVVLRVLLDDPAHARTWLRGLAPNFLKHSSNQSPKRPLNTLSVGALRSARATGERELRGRPPGPAGLRGGGDAAGLPRRRERGVTAGRGRSGLRWGVRASVSVLKGVLGTFFRVFKGVLASVTVFNRVLVRFSRGGLVPFRVFRERCVPRARADSGGIATGGGSSAESKCTQSAEETSG